jgi:aryl-alcohol dehydrogenase-like predicted oxidoreductase
VSVLARVVDYGGVFWDDVIDEQQFPEHDHRRFRPEGWVERARAKLDRIRPIAQLHGLTPLQLAAAWTLAQPAVACVAPTLIQEAGPQARPIEQKRTELAAVPAVSPLSASELAEIDAVGDNTGSMALKGGSPVHLGEPRADAWPLDDELRATAQRWGIAPERDLVMAAGLASA